MNSAFKASFVLLLCSMAMSAARSDDGILYFHGEPELLRNGGTIRMTQEFVRAKIYKDYAKVYCRFWLRNDGPAKTVRIGFPDGSDHDYEFLDEPNVKPEPILEDFRSTVDGKPVAVHLVRTNLEKYGFAFFRTKNVRFAAHQTRVIEDWYKVPLDTDHSSTPGFSIHSFTYPMFSGASWKGKIGQATVQIDFMRGSVKHPKLARISGDELPPNYDNWNRVNKSTIYWKGFAKPRLTGQTIIFQRRNFEPRKSDDIGLYFGPRPW